MAFHFDRNCFASAGVGRVGRIGRLRIAAAAALVMFLSGCGPRDAQTSAAGGGPSSSRLYVLDGGVLQSDPARYRLSADEVAAAELSIAAYLVVHPRGVLLWDAAAIADDERISAEAGVVQRVVRTDGQERVVTLARPLLSQLADAGYSADDVDWLALSHYHWDHTANANAFAGATWLVRPADRGRMFADELPGGTRPSTYSALERSRTTLVTEDEHDVFGDGTVVLKSAPGHTEGHQVLFVQLENSGGIVLSGDLYHHPEERTLGRLPVAELDVAQTDASRREVDALLARTGAALWVQHDLVGHRALRKAPAYYD